MERFVDYSGEPYAIWAILRRGDSVMVRCDCGSMAYIRREGEEKDVVLTCPNCMLKKIYGCPASYQVSTRCDHCERWFNEYLKDERQFTHRVLHYPCPHCGAVQAVSVKKRFDNAYYSYVIEGERDPYFKMPLYFVASFRGKPVWALNRDHLQYMIDYISADQRQRPSYAYTRTASYRLPRYMKEAKNREDIVKLLKRMQNQT